MVSRILAFRPATAVDRLDPRSDACPLTARELLGPAAELGLVLPIVRAPIAPVARGALVAAKELGAVVALALPPGVAPEPWFAAVTRAADEIAAGLPVVLCAEVIVEGQGATQVERALREAWRLCEAGLTHLAFDVAAVSPGERGRILGELVPAGAEHGMSVEAIVSLAEGSQVGPRAAATFEEVARIAAAPDAAGVRCPLPRDASEARLQAGALARFCQALRGTPVMRRGPVSANLLELLRGSPLRGCEDGGAVAARAVGGIPAELVHEGEERGAERGPSRLERAAAQLSGEGADRLEACAYVDAVELIERVGARGSAPALARALERRLVEP